MDKAEKKFDIYCIGNYCIDIMIKPVDKFPEPGGVVGFDTFKITTGGCGNNTAIALAKLGQSVFAAGLVGSDQLGYQILETLSSNNVDTGGIVRHPDLPTSLSIVLINTKGERSFIYNIGANIALSPDYFHWDIIAQSRILHIAGVGLYPKLTNIALSEVLKKAKKMGVLTSVDTALPPKGKRMESIALSFPYIDYFLPSLVEANALTGTDKPEIAAEIFLKEGVGTIVIKMGEIGSYVATNEERWLVPAFDVDVKDTCGAGDTSVAGFLTGILRNFKPQRAAQFANAVGALCITAIGATTGVRSYEDTMQFIENNNEKIPKPVQINKNKIKGELK